MSNDYEFFKFRKEAKTCISKLLTWNGKDTGRRGSTPHQKKTDERQPDVFCAGHLP